jgi:hypothetical protein
MRFTRASVSELWCATNRAAMRMEEQSNLTIDKIVQVFLCEPANTLRSDRSPFDSLTRSLGQLTTTRMNVNERHFFQIPHF